MTMKPKAKKKRGYRRALTMTGRSPEGYIPTSMDNEHRQKLMRLLDVGARKGKASLACRTHALQQIQVVIDRYEQSASKVPLLSSVPVPSVQAEQAKRVIKAGRALLRVIDAADSETIKRMAIRRAERVAGKSPSRSDRDAARSWVKRALPQLLSEIVEDAQYALARVDHHRGGGRRPDDPALHTLIVELARAWVIATGQSFRGSRENASANGTTRVGSERRYIEFVLTGILDLSLIEAQIDDYMTSAARIIRRDEDLESPEDATSGSDRFA
ncbi:hypothetical protein [uncultured Reyranella sp.]|uniref:hypothetical protein n=1 Tax=uncultured Reyranella sp. TaxID=735512 RepID=UPI0025FA269B|nr:hypothetical protein [uncultured Reyranella sp.]